MGLNKNYWGRSVKQEELKWRVAFLLKQLICHATRSRW